MLLDKFDIARNALCGAIWLYISTPYHSAAHTLAGACSEIVNALMPSFSEQDRKGAAQGSRALSTFCENAGRTTEEYISLNSRLRFTYNFLKHADREPQSNTYLHPRLTEDIIFVAICDYMKLRKGIPIEAQVFDAWYLAMNPHKIAVGHEEYITKLECMFPDIVTMDHNQQKDMCRNYLEATAGNLDLTMEELKPSPYSK